MAFSYVRAVFEMEPTWKTPAEFAVLVTLANFADREGVAYPSKPTIARRVGVKRRQVWNLTRRLEAQGLIVIESGLGPRGCDRYLLTFGPTASARTLAIQCQGEETATLAIQCQGKNNDPGNRDPLTLAIADDDPGNGMPRPWQSSATNPKDPKRDPAASPLSTHSQQKENDEQERILYRQVRGIADAHVDTVGTRDELVARLQNLQPDVHSSIVERAATGAWGARILFKSKRATA